MDAWLKAAAAEYVARHPELTAEEREAIQRAVHRRTFGGEEEGKR